MNPDSARKYVAVLVLILSANPPLYLIAQTAGAAPAPGSIGNAGETVQMEKVIVTGSYIPFAADAPAIPIKIVTTQQIESTGVAGDLLEVIRKTAPQFIGNGNLGSSNSNIQGVSTNGGSQIKLRNVQTLVLVNGRRAAFAPVAATGGNNFVDINAIPVSAVDRIEILTDGASAIYGSDAVSGVVNIILKKDFEGGEVGGAYATDTRGGRWKERSARAIEGVKFGKTSMTMSVEWAKTDPLFEDQRGFSFDQTGKTFIIPGAVLPFEDFGNYRLREGVAPPLNADFNIAQLLAMGIYEGPFTSEEFSGLFNLAPYVTLTLANEKIAITNAFSHDFNEKLELFGDMLYSKKKTSYQLAAQPIFGMPFASAQVTDFGFGIGVTDPGHPHNPFDNYVIPWNRFVSNPRRYRHDAETWRLLAGLRGNINDRYSWEGAVNYNKAEQEYRNANVINRANLAAGIDAGLINLFAREQDPSNLSQANLFGTASSDNDSTLFTADLKLNGEIPGMLRSGPVKFAVGLETREETLKASPDPGSFTITDPADPQFGFPASWDGATTYNPFDKSRTVESAFAEARIPLAGPEQRIKGLHALELNVAGRYERYSDADDPLVPKVLLRYLPFDDHFAIRASYQKAFTAPDLFSLFGPTGVGFTDTIVAFQRFDGAIISQADQAFLRVPTNPNLGPEKAESHTLGFVYSPKKVKGLTIEAGYFRIKQKDLLGRVDEFDILQDVELKGAASPYAGRVRINGFNGTPITAPGDISAAVDAFGGSFLPVYVTNFVENFRSAEQSGVDFSADYSFKVESIGAFDVRLSGTWFESFTVEGDQFAGTTSGQTISNGGTIPKWHTQIYATLTRGNWLAGLRTEYISSVKDIEAGNRRDEEVEAYSQLDLFASYDFKRWKRLDGLKVRVGVNNVLDEPPPFAPASWTDSGADTATYGAVGRAIYMDASFRF